MEFGFKIRIFSGILCAITWGFGQVHINNIDEVLSTDKGPVLVRLYPLQFLRLDSISLQSGTVDSLEWIRAVRPSQQFRPTKISKGQFQNFLVYDQSQKKFWQLDSGFQVLTGMDIPKELVNTNLNLISFFYSPTNRLLIFQPEEGWIYQFVERVGKLFLIQKDAVPLNMETCMLLELEPNYPITCYRPGGLDVFGSQLNQHKFLKWRDENIKLLHPKGLNFYTSGLKRTSNGQIQIIYRMADKKFCFEPQTGDFKDCTKH